ncbi:unnamed protein product [Caenorhabditis brenneri]
METDPLQNYHELYTPAYYNPQDKMPTTFNDILRIRKVFFTPEKPRKTPQQRTSGVTDVMERFGQRQTVKLEHLFPCKKQEKMKPFALFVVLSSTDPKNKNNLYRYVRPLFWEVAAYPLDHLAELTNQYTSVDLMNGKNKKNEHISVLDLLVDGDIIAVESIQQWVNPKNSREMGEKKALEKSDKFCVGDYRIVEHNQVTCPTLIVPQKAYPKYTMYPTGNRTNIRPVLLLQRIMESVFQTEPQQQQKDMPDFFYRTFKTILTKPFDKWMSLLPSLRSDSYGKPFFKDYLYEMLFPAIQRSNPPYFLRPMVLSTDDPIRMSDVVTEDVDESIKAVIAANKFEEYNQTRDQRWILLKITSKPTDDKAFASIIVETKTDVGSTWKIGSYVKVLGLPYNNPLVARIAYNQKQKNDVTIIRLKFYGNACLSSTEERENGEDEGDENEDIATEIVKIDPLFLSKIPTGELTINLEETWIAARLIKSSSYHPILSHIPLFPNTEFDSELRNVASYYLQQVDQMRQQLTPRPGDPRPLATPAFQDFPHTLELDFGKLLRSPGQVTEEQRLVLQYMLNSPLSKGKVLHIDAPFGSGKTSTIAAAVLLYVRYEQYKKADVKVVFLTEKNFAAASFLLYLEQNGQYIDGAHIRPLYIPSKSFSETLADDTDSKFCVNKLMMKLFSEELRRHDQNNSIPKDRTDAQFEDFSVMFKYVHSLNPEFSLSTRSDNNNLLHSPTRVRWESALRLLIRLYRPTIIISTISVLENYSITLNEFPTVTIIDESTMLSTGTILRLRGLLHEWATNSFWIFLGDTRQIGPYCHLRQLDHISSRSVCQDMLECSNVYRVQLTWVFRCHPHITAVVSRAMYDGTLKSPETLKLNHYPQYSPSTPLQYTLPKKKKGLRFFTKPSHAEQHSDSWYNTEEAEQVVAQAERLVTHWKNCRPKDRDTVITLLTPYLAQYTELQRLVNLSSVLKPCYTTSSNRPLASPRFKIRISTVRAFQGQKSDAVLLSVVRDINDNCKEEDLISVNKLTVLSALTHKAYPSFKLRISTVRAFQGQTSNVVILSVVRDVNETYEDDDELHKLTVLSALTRSRKFTQIFLPSTTAACSIMWKQIITLSDDIVV